MSLDHEPDLIGRYRPVAGPYDELLGPDGVRAHWSTVAERLAAFGAAELSRRADESRRLLVDDWVSYNVSVDGTRSARPWTLDPVPTLIAADEWAHLDAGLAQRATLLDLVLTDLHGRRELLTSGILPPEVVYGHPGFLRACDQITLPGRHQLILAAFDLGRDVDGSWVVLGDRAQAPSGVGYALENRLVVSRVFPDIYRDAEVVRLAPFFRELRAALQQAAPPTDGPPTIVVLTPGGWSETFFEHGYLASYLGYPLVHGSDLRVRDGRVWMRSLGRLTPVDVILRRVDAEWCDPLELEPSSQLGVPGLLEACRLGSVSVVNTLGSGAIENPALLAFLPRIARALLGEDLALPSVETHWCGEPEGLRYVLDHLDELALKPVRRGDGGGTVLGWTLSADERRDLRARIEARPRDWVGQEAIPLGVAPTLVGEQLEPRRTVLRTFAVATDDGYALMPGGLTRVAPRPDEALITNQHGAWSKDTWVLAREPEQLTGFWLSPSSDMDIVRPAAVMSSRAAENLFWMSRYAERAEALVRHLRVVSDRISEFAPGTNPAGNTTVQVLLEALTRTTGVAPGFVGEDAAARLAAPVAEMLALLADSEREGSVAHSVRRMLDAATEVRDQLSSDTWLVFGHLDRDLAVTDRSHQVSAVTGALGNVMQALLALSGLAAESMVRDDGWQFMEAGRRIERALHLCSLLRATVTTRRDAATDSLVVESVLTTCDSIITYRRRYRSRAQIETMLDLLLLDAGNPRALAFQVDALVAATDAIPSDPDADRGPLGALLSDLSATVHLADTNALAAVDADSDALGRLDAYLANCADLLRAVSDELDVLHFTHQLPQRPVAPTHHPSAGHLGATGAA